MLADFVRGARYVLQGLAWLRRPGLRRFVALPLLINTLLFSVAIGWGWRLLQNHVLDALPGWLHWLTWLIVPLFSVGILLIVFYSFTLLANLIGSPFNALLAEKVEMQASAAAPQDKPGGLTRISHRITAAAAQCGALAGETARSLVSELRKLLYLALWSLPLLLLFFIPGVNAIAAFLWFAFSAWMLALEYIDCPMANHGYAFRQQRQILKQHRWLAWGFGSAMLLMTLTPLLNFFAMPTGVIGATLMWLEIRRRALA